MKKVSAILLALVLSLSMVMFAAAKTTVQDDVDAFIKELSDVADADEIKAAVNEALAKADVKADADAAEISDAQTGTVADTIIAKFNLEGEKAEKVQKAMSNDFVSFLAGLYIGKPVPPVEPPVTGASAVIAIAAFATLSMAAAAAFVTSKKED
jgi:uncharacterized protein YxeA